MSNEIFSEITAMENEIFNEIPANEQWNIWWNKCHGEQNIQWNTYQWAMKYLMKYVPCRMRYSMKYLPMSDEIIDHTAAMENEMLNEIFTIEQWNISCWAMKYSMKFARILNETGLTLNENAFHSFVVAKQIFLWQLPQLHRCNWQLLVSPRRSPGTSPPSATQQNSFQFPPVLSVFLVPRNLERKLSRKITTFCKVQVRVGLSWA